MKSEEFFANLQGFNTKYLEALNLIMKKKIEDKNEFNPFNDLLGMQNAYLQAVTDFTNNPAKFFQHNLEYASKVSNLMFHFMEKIHNDEKIDSLYNSSPRDKRFKDQAWQDSMYFNFVKQFYLMSCQWHRSLVGKLEVDASKKKILEFYTEHILNAASPTNFINLNPEVINELVETNGQNLIQGIENFIEDLKKSEQIPFITTASEKVFEVGKNIAASEGKVIYENELAQLIHYKPKKNQVYSIPIFIVPPWINKYYILDLSKDNSFINYLLESGFQVFLISWVNPDSSLSHKGFDDYMKQGIIDPIRFLQQKFNIKEFNLIGYCLGGTLSACVNAYLTEQENPFKSTTYLTTLLDFSQPGDLGLFINKETIEAIKDQIQKRGYFSGKYMSYAFSLLRSNELIWSFVVNNYLLGKKPIAFDLLYWNSDNTNLPAKMHSFYLENMYVENNLIRKDGIKLLDRNIDLSKISRPSFFLSTKEDHIAPWEATYMSAKKLSSNKISDCTFCLAASGHIAGVVNPPQNKKYSYWVNTSIPQTSDKWFEDAKQHKGSWWDYWIKWIETRSGKKTEPLEYENIEYIEKAPGRYVKKRID